MRPDATLDFEQRYRERERGEIARACRLFTGLCAALFPAFGLLDVITQPAASPALLSIRFVTTALFAALLLVPKRLLQRHPYAAALVQLELAAASITAMCLVLDGYRSPYYAGINLVVLSAGLLFGWNARRMAAAVAMIVGTYLVCVLIRAGFAIERVDLLVNSLYFLLATGIISVASSHLGDRLRRESFRQFLSVESAREDLRRQDEIKSRFFANVSHELRTPLTLILGPVRSLLGKQGLAPDARSELEVVERNAGVLLDRVNDLLEVARLDARAAVLQPQRVDLAALVRRVASQFEALRVRRGDTLTLEAPEHLPAEVDPARIERVLANLLGNAFKFTPAPGSIRCALSSGSGVARIVVADSGPGIAEPLRESVFERFFQVEPSATRVHGGTGLGLAIVREFVQLHGGSARVTGSPLGGAQFEITLPLFAHRPLAAPDALSPAADLLTEPPLSRPGAALSQAPLSAPDPARLVPAGGAAPALSPAAPLVLVVEDNSDMNSFIQRILAGSFRVAAAFDGRAGLAEARRLRPDLIITDVMMPGMSGPELIRELRAVEELRDLPVVVLTARADDSLRLDLLRSGVHETVLKPFVPDELLARVSNLVELSRSREILRTQLEAASGDLESMSRDVAQRSRDLQQASRELEAARDQAVRALRLREEFISIASHELRTPLTSLKLAAQLAARQFQKERGDGAQPDATSGVLDRLSGQVQRMAMLVEEMLDFSRVQSGRLEIERAPADLAAVVRGVIEEFRERSGGAGPSIQIDARSAVRGEWDAFRLAQVVRNLIGNALKYGARQPVQVDVEGADGEAVLRVRDRGIGIAPQDRERIFEPFERAVPSREISGFGLGLYIARQIVEAHGGSIAVESAPSQGSIFTVRLPTSPPGRSLEPLPATPAKQSLG